MNCKQCGKEIPDNSVFCPFCGVPMKMTADYDYIQGEIGANVNKIKTGEVGKAKTESAPARKKRPSNEGNDLNKTRNMYGRDTIYEEERKPVKPVQETRKPVQESRRPVQETRRPAYRDDYYDDYYDDRYDDYEYEDWGMETRKGGNGKTIATTIIIALLCLAGIAAIIYFGLRPQDKGTAVDVVRCFDLDNVEVSEGAAFENKLEVTLHSEQGYPIHYTLDGEEPDENSPLYTGTIIVTEPGAVTVKAVSFDKKGNPSGEGLSKTFEVVAESEEETTAADEKKKKDDEPAVSKEEAEKIVEKALVDSGAMNEDYSTENGGFINLVHAGEAELDGVSYYVVQADYYDSEGSIWESTYYGVTTDEGTLTYLDKQGDTFTIVE